MRLRSDEQRTRDQYRVEATRHDQGLSGLLCLVLPFFAVLINKGPCIEVLWAFLLQLLGHIPGVIYGIYQIVKD